MKLIINSNTEKRNLVIVSNSQDETITRFIMNNKQKLEENVMIILLQDLLVNYEIFDELSDAGASINWKKGNDIQVTNSDHLLLNRVLNVPSTLFNDFIEEDRSYAQRELEAYIGFSFNTFVGVGNQSANGVCVDSLSLPQQWKRIKKEFKMNVPHYYWGPAHTNGLSNSDNLVYSQIYNLLNWSTSINHTDQNHIFCFEKPPGHPAFILSIGTRQLVTSDWAIPIAMENELKKIAENINRHFKYFISEILIFVKGSDFTFGCINPEIVRSNKNKDLEDFILNNLMSEFYKCIH